jgi:thymidylate synthase ThyX
MQASARDRDTVEGWAKEDARYALCLATEAQLGFSANARNLEHVIRKLRHHGLAEVRALSAALYEAAAQVVPSLIILSDPERFRETFGRDVSDEHLAHWQGDVRAASREIMRRWSDPAAGMRSDAQTVFATQVRSGDVKLVDHALDPDLEIASALAFQAGAGDYGKCRQTLASLRRKDEKAFAGFVMESVRRLTEFDAPPRAFETTLFTFEIEASASAFAQLKRHRMTTQLKQPYDPELGCTLPPSVEQTGLGGQFEQVFEASARAWAELSGSAGREAAEYALTNAHRRRVLVACNLREVYHLARIRMDAHAQWDIRKICGDMVEVARGVAPVAASLATGKDTFAQVRKAVLGE